MPFKMIQELKDLRGKSVLLRLDLNVPIQDGKVLDDFRIKASLPTLDYLKQAGARVVIMSHIGEGGQETLQPVADYLGLPLLPLKLDTLKSELSSLQPGQAVLLENLRQDPREVANDSNFAAELASLGDIYVNDAFSVSHRKHASIVSLPKLLPSYAGFLIQSEVEHLSMAFNPEHPFLFIIGGAKFETKINLVRRFIDLADKIFIGGALANTLLKKKGYEVGTSLVDDKSIDLDFVLNSEKVILPSDVSVIDGAGRVIKPADQVLADENILDIGSEALAELEHMISGAKFVLWNGPLGNFERGFKSMTEDLAKYIAASGAQAIVGGGDTLAAISGLGILDRFAFVSSGGGAMLDFLANGTLPGIEALESN